MQDEILAKALDTDTEVIPRYDVVLPDGTKVAENAELVLKNPVTQEGTPYNKESVLQDETAALYGLEDATVDQVLQFLGKYNLYWWRRRTKTISIGEPQNIPATSEESLVESVAISRGNSTSDATTFSYSSSIEISEDGSGIILSAPVSDTLSYNTYLTSEVTTKLSGKYYKSYAGNIWYVPENPNIRRYTISSSPEYCVWVTPTSLVSLSIGEWEYIQSADRSAYPDSGFSGGYEYQFLNSPFQNFILPGAQIATGSYVGTGTYGSSNPKSLTFDFEPKFVLIFGSGSGSSAAFAFLSFLSQTGSAVQINSTVAGTLPASWVGNTVTWYSTTSANLQMNETNVTYSYISLG